jgi:hypothetical protein
VKIPPALLFAAAVVSAACARGGSEDRPDTPGLAGAPTADSAAVTGVPTPAPPVSSAPSSGDRTPPRASGTAAPTRPAQRPADRAPSTPAPPPPSSSTPGAADTARGIIAVVGAVPITEVVLRPASGRPITLTGPLANEIGVASGADVWVRGRRVDTRTIDVASYAVRTVDGVTAITGTLTAEGDRLVLVTDDGRRHPIARPPAPLREHVGARVWITGDLGTTINAYGVLRPRR